MSFPSRVEPKRRTRTRTLLGCLTCRSRKVKCGEERPTCSNCSRLHLTCQGYDPKLQWLESSSPHGIGDSETSDRRGLRHLYSAQQRIEMIKQITNSFAGPDVSNDLNEALEHLDREAFELSTGEEHHTMLTRGPFGVFKLDSSRQGSEKPMSSSKDTLNEFADTPETSEQSYLDIFNTNVQMPVELLSQEWLATFPDEHSFLTPSEDLFAPMPSPSATLDRTSPYTLSVQIPDPNLSSNTPETTISLETSPQRQSEDSLISQLTSSSYAPMGEIAYPFTEDQNFSLPSPFDSVMPTSFGPYLPPQVQFLLNHYLQHVIGAMSPMHVANSPWRAIYLPCATKAFAELTLYGQTNLAKVSLLYSLLSISAFHLDGKYTEAREDITLEQNVTSSATITSRERSKWHELGLKYRKIAKIGLQKCLEGGIVLATTRAKYKEILLAMLSMVTSGIISNNMEDTHVCLLQSQAIIQDYGLQSLQSKKITILHHIFSYIRVIGASTFVHSQKKYLEQFPPSESDTHGSAILEPKSLSRLSPVYHLPQSADAETVFLGVYGVSGTLLSLLSQTSLLLTEVHSVMRDQPIPSSLESRIKRIENAICSWKPASPQDNSPSTELILSTHISSAMHNALIVYFFRQIRRTNPHILQQYLEKVVEHLHAHQEIKERGKVDAGGIVWPGFIAACEATDAQLRVKALRCILYAGQCGFRNYETAERVVREVWRRREVSRGEEDVNWMTVVRDLGLHMVLT